MAFILTPRFVPAYQAPQSSPFGFCAPPRHPAYASRGACSQPRRPQQSPFSHFFGEVDELLSEIDRQAKRQAQQEAIREAHRQRQQRKRALRAHFVVSENEQGWQVDGDVHGFEREHISIEVTDENTLKISGNTEWHSKEADPEQQNATSAAEQATIDVAPAEKTVSVAPTEAETATVAADSDTESHKSYQATVEDDFEDLGAETASLISASSTSSTVSVPEEPKGKEKAAAELADAIENKTAAPEPTPEQQNQEQERPHGSFERTFRFPTRIDAANLRASFVEGALHIVVPRAPAQEIRSITIM